MAYKDPLKKKEKRKEYYEKNKERAKESREKTKEKTKEYDTERLETRKQYAFDSITSGSIIDKKKWDMLCNEIKRCAKKNKNPYSDDFANDMMFKMMLRGCFYCGDIATGIDRIDSTLYHTPDNCVGCCWGCNNSKGVTDLSSFVRKSYYRARGKYADDDNDFWFVNKNKPSIASYKYNAKKQGVPFDLTKEYFDAFTKGDCAYCKRSPTTWFGIDRIVPTIGYVIGNVVSCCYDCNLDKLDSCVENTRIRNERIAVRVDAGVLVINNRGKAVIHKWSRE